MSSQRDEPDLALDEAFDAAGETVADDPGMTSLGIGADGGGAIAANHDASATSSRSGSKETDAGARVAPKACAIDRTCVLCGIDCHDQARTKDTKGRYFCLPCFHRALTAKEAGTPLAIPRRRVSSTARSLESDSGLAIDDFVVSEDSPLRQNDASGSLSAGWTGSSEAMTGSSCSLLCPECRTPMPSEAICCPACGVHTLGGRRWTTRAATAVRLAEDDSTESTWCAIVGGVSTGLGAVGVITGLALTASAIFAFANGSHTETLVARATLGPGIALLAGWKLSAGLDCLRRRPVAIDHLRCWATTTLVILVLAAAAWIAWTCWSESDWSARIHHITFAVIGAALLSIWPLVIRWWSRHAVL